MTALTGWRRVIGHQGTFLAALNLWPPERGGRARHLQSGYRALWLLRDTSEPAPQMGPIDLVGARSLAPGATGTVLIHPMLPEAWRSVDAGTTLDLLAPGRHPRVIGTATVLERRDVPASAPLNLEPIEESEARARLHAVADPPAVTPSSAVPPTVTVGTTTLPLLSSSWGGTGRGTTGPGSRAEEIELAARLPRPDIRRDRPVTITVTDGELPVSGEVGYFSAVDADGIPAGERRDVQLDSRTLLRDIGNATGGRWSLRIPQPGGAQAVVVMLSFAPDPPGTPTKHAAWGFRVP